MDTTQGNDDRDEYLSQKLGMDVPELLEDCSILSRLASIPGLRVSYRGGDKLHFVSICKTHDGIGLELGAKYGPSLLEAAKAAAFQAFQALDNTEALSESAREDPERSRRTSFPGLTTLSYQL